MRLFLLDGMALIYRAHFAFITNPIRNSKGINTSAIFGFTNTLLTIIEKENPTHLGVAFDTNAPTFRHIQYPAYKAQRDAAPEELIAAIPEIKRLCKAFDIPILELDGYEADDIIGTVANRADLEGGIDTFMVTPDKDFAQLVSSATSIFRPGKKGADHEVLNIAAILQNWEIIRPEQVIDILGLWGDASDNIPGVPGVGEKTAKKLIAEWDSMENLLTNASKIKGKLGENLQTYQSQALLSKELATIRLDVPIHSSWDDLKISLRNESAIRKLFTEFEFRTLTKRIFPEIYQKKEPAREIEPSPIFANLKTIRDIEHTYQIANTTEKRKQLFDELGKQNSFCFDVETTSLNRFEADLLGIAFSWKTHEAWYLPTQNVTEFHDQLAKIFSNSSEKIGHNLKFDISILNHYGIEVLGKYFDTMLAHSLLHQEKRHGMDYLAETILGYSTIKFSDISQPTGLSNTEASDDLFSFAEKVQTKKKQHLSVANIPLEVLAEYAAEDADITFQLAEMLKEELKRSEQENVFHQIEAPLLPVLTKIENNGITIDTTALTKIGNELQLTIDHLTTSIQQHAGQHFNLNSPKQLGEILFDKLNLIEKAKKTTTGQFKTDEATLSSLEGKHPIISNILQYREAAKLKSTYIDALPTHIQKKTGRIHTSFHQLMTATGRMASSDPNLQNIPIRSILGKKIRQAFIPRDKNFTLLSCDYSQIELRVMAALSGDFGMIEAFHQKLDIHTATAAKVYKVDLLEVTKDMRNTAKMVNFGIIYGISPFGLSQRLGISRTEATEIIETYFEQYPSVKNFMDQTILRAKDNGYVETLSKRRRYLPDLNSSNKNIASNAERAAINTPIQGTAADMIKLAMIQIDELLQSSYQSKMLLQVHDELVFDLHVSEQEELIPEIITIMKTALILPNDVPIEVESGTGDNWLAAH
jgi:DNA polymerase I